MVPGEKNSLEVSTAACENSIAAVLSYRPLFSPGTNFSAAS
jgi:hypothetical protein